MTQRWHAVNTAKLRRAIVARAVIPPAKRKNRPPQNLQAVIAFYGDERRFWSAVLKNAKANGGWTKLDIARRAQNGCKIADVTRFMKRPTTHNKHGANIKVVMSYLAALPVV